jgi:DOPA 4,5-dioxygenase
MPDVTGYHAHVYFDTATHSVAEQLRDAIAARFSVEPGRFSLDPIGPHPISQFNVIFKIEQFQEVVPWLMLHREGLDILVHPLTNDMVDDHTIYALWLGKPVDLTLGHMQRRGYNSDLLPSAAQAA